MFGVLAFANVTRIQSWEVQKTMQTLNKKAPYANLTKLKKYPKIGTPRTILSLMPEP